MEIICGMHSLHRDCAWNVTKKMLRYSVAIDLQQRFPQLNSQQPILSLDSGHDNKVDELHASRFRQGSAFQGSGTPQHRVPLTFTCCRQHLEGTRTKGGEHDGRCQGAAQMATAGLGKWRVMASMEPKETTRARPIAPKLQAQSDNHFLPNLGVNRQVGI